MTSRMGRSMILTGILILRWSMRCSWQCGTMTSLSLRERWTRYDMLSGLGGWVSNFRDGSWMRWNAVGSRTISGVERAADESLPRLHHIKHDLTFSLPQDHPQAKRVPEHLRYTRNDPAHRSTPTQHSTTEWNPQSVHRRPHPLECTIPTHHDHDPHPTHILIHTCRLMFTTLTLFPPTLHHSTTLTTNQCTCRLDPTLTP